MYTTVHVTVTHSQCTTMYMCLQLVYTMHCLITTLRIYTHMYIRTVQQYYSEQAILYTIHNPPPSHTLPQPHVTICIDEQATHEAVCSLHSSQAMMYNVKCTCTCEADNPPSYIYTQSMCDYKTTCIYLCTSLRAFILALKCGMLSIL